MTRPATPLVVLAVVFAAMVSPLAAAAPQHVSGPSNSMAALQESGNESAGNDTAPGATLNGALGSEGAELEGEFEQRSLDRALAAVDSVDARSAVVADRLAAVEERLAELQARQERLEEARNNGSITDAEYRARMTTLAAQARSLDRLGARTASYAAALPPEALAEREVTPERVAELRTRASNLSAFEEDLFDGTYGEGFRDEIPEPTPDETFDDSWWNVSAPNETAWNGTDEFEWNGTDWNGTDWNGTFGNETWGDDWNETSWNGTG